MSGAALAGGRASAAGGSRAKVSAKLSTNPFAYSFGLQDPELGHPGSPAPDMPPEHVAITQAQIDNFHRDGVVHIDVLPR